jgi:plastocyanin
VGIVGAGRHISIAAALLSAVAFAACGSDGGDLGTGGGGGSALSAARSEPSGNGQSAEAGHNVGNSLRIVVLRGATPDSGAIVTWNAGGTGALMTPVIDTTGRDGISTSVWQLGSEVGTQTSNATVIGGADGSPVPFTATATAPGGGGPAPVGIQLRNDGGNRFEPSSVTVPVGTTVTWTWVGGFHDVTSAGDPPFVGSGDPVSAPHSFSHTFTSTGTYVYFCSVHGSPSGGMRGTIVVQ